MIEEEIFLEGLNRWRNALTHLAEVEAELLEQGIVPFTAEITTGNRITVPPYVMTKLKMKVGDWILLPAFKLLRTETPPKKKTRKVTVRKKKKPTPKLAPAEEPIEEQVEEPIVEPVEEPVVETEPEVAEEELTLEEPPVEPEEEKPVLLTDQQRFDQQLIELHAEGFNDREIGEKLGMKKGTVRDRRNKLGIKAQKPKRLFTNQRLIELHADGLTDKEIAERLDTSAALIGYHRKRLGLKPNESKPKPEEDLLEKEQVYVEQCPHGLDRPLQNPDVCQDCIHYKKKHKLPEACKWTGWKKIEDEEAEEETGTVMRWCDSASHNGPRIHTHRREVLGDGRIRYTCAICGKETIDDE